MARILSIDYGKKRTGLAVTDPSKIIANGLATVDTEQLIWYLKQYFAGEEVEKVVIGYPLGLDGKETDITKKVEKFYSQFQKLFPHIPAQLIDERFTSKMATRAIIDSGLKKKDRQNKALVDEVSAVILLQGYLEKEQ